MLPTEKPIKILPKPKGTEYISEFLALNLHISTLLTNI